LSNPPQSTLQTHEIKFWVLVILPNTDIPSIGKCSNSCIQPFKVVLHMCLLG
jgi:hypothetical protein